jgi:flavin-dependent dehydrogenase
MSFDVVIVGGGPAGLAAAVVLSRHGIKTLLCEAAELPVDKACGEGLMPRGVSHCERLGIPRLELEALGHPIAGVRYVSPHGRSAEARFAAGRGLGIRRTLLARALLERAERQRALTLVSRAPARLVGGRPKPCVDVAGTRLEPRLILGADGVNSLIRKHADVEYRVIPPLRFGLRRHYRVRETSELVEVHWCEGAEAYVTPTGRHQANVALLWDREPSRFEPEVRHGSGFVRHFPELERELAPLDPETSLRAAGPMHHEVPLPARDGLLLIGDAAGYVDALTGDGVALALEQALLLEELVVPRLRSLSEGQVLPVRALEPYLRAADRARSHNKRLTRWLLRVKSHPALLERVIAVLAADPDLFQHFLSAAEGRISPLRAPIAGAAKLIAGLARPRVALPG